MAVLLDHKLVVIFFAMRSIAKNIALIMILLLQQVDGIFDGRQAAAEDQRQRQQAQQGFFGGRAKSGIGLEFGADHFAQHRHLLRQPAREDQPAPVAGCEFVLAGGQTQGAGVIIVRHVLECGPEQVPNRQLFFVDIGNLPSVPHELEKKARSTWSRVPFTALAVWEMYRQGSAQPDLLGFSQLREQPHQQVERSPGRDVGDAGQELPIEVRPRLEISKF